MTRAADRMLKVSLAIGIGFCVLVTDEQASLINQGWLVTQAEARIGRPLTPMSYAGDRSGCPHGGCTIDGPTGRGGSDVLPGRRCLWPRLHQMSVIGAAPKRSRIRYRSIGLANPPSAVALGGFDRAKMDSVTAAVNNARYRHPHRVNYSGSNFSHRFARTCFARARSI